MCFSSSIDRADSCPSFAHWAAWPSWVGKDEVLHKDHHVSQINLFHISYTWILKREKKMSCLI